MPSAEGSTLVEAAPNALEVISNVAKMVEHMETLQSKFNAMTDRVVKEHEETRKLMGELREWHSSNALRDSALRECMRDVDHMMRWMHEKIEEVAPTPKSRRSSSGRSVTVEGGCRDR